jgi:hypothetical protein
MAAQGYRLIRIASGIPRWSAQERESWLSLPARAGRGAGVAILCDRGAWFARSL